MLIPGSSNQITTFVAWCIHVVALRQILTCVYYFVLTTHAGGNPETTKTSHMVIQPPQCCGCCVKPGHEPDVDQKIASEEAHRDMQGVTDGLLDRNIIERSDPEQIYPDLDSEIAEFHSVKGDRLMQTVIWTSTLLFFAYCYRRFYACYIFVTNCKPSRCTPIWHIIKVWFWTLWTQWTIQQPQQCSHVSHK